MRDLQKVKEALEKIALISENRVANKPDVTHDTIAFLKIGDAAHEALAELEKLADENIVFLLSKIRMGRTSSHIVGTFELSDEKAIEKIQKCAESYHAKQCHTCPKLKNALGMDNRDRDAEIERIAEKE